MVAVSKPRPAFPHSVYFVFCAFCLIGLLEARAVPGVGMGRTVPPAVRSEGHHKLVDEVTLTEKKKPWRGPSKLSTTKLNLRGSNVPTLGAEAPIRSLMTQKERDIFDRQSAEQANILKDVVSGKSIAPPPPPLPVVPAATASIKELGGKAAGAINTMRQKLPYSSKPRDVLEQVARGDFEMPGDIRGSEHGTYKEASVTPLHPPAPTTTMDEVMGRSTHAHLAKNGVDKAKMEADWNKFIANKKNLLPPLDAKGKNPGMTPIPRDPGLATKSLPVPNNQPAPVVGSHIVDIDNFDPFEHVTEMNEHGKKRAPELQAPPSERVSIATPVKGGDSGAGLTAQLLNSEPSYEYTRLPKGAWPSGGNH